MRDDAALDDLRRHAGSLHGARQQWVLGLAVEQPADHIRTARVTELEPDQHLVADLGQEQVAPLLAHPDLNDPRPVALVERGQPWEAELDPAHRVGVVVVGDHADHVAVDRRRAHAGAAQRGQAEQRAVVAAADLEVRRVAADLRFELVTGGRHDPFADELFGDSGDLDLLAGLDAGVAVRGARGLEDRARQVLGHALGHLVDSRRGRRTPVERPIDDDAGGHAGHQPEARQSGDARKRRERERQPHERPGESRRIRIVVELGRAGLQLRRADDHLGRLVVVDAHLDVGGDVRRAAPRPEPLQVLLEGERRRASAEEAAGRVGDRATNGSERAALRLGARGLAEEELALGDAGLEADLLGAHPQEVPVGLGDLRHVSMGGGGVADVGLGEPGLAGDLRGDVGVLHVDEGARAAGPLQTM